MADPTIVSCTKKTWTKVVDNETSGSITNQIQKFYKPDVYYTWVDTGGTEPTTEPGLDGNKAALMESRFLPFNKPVSIDVYVWPAKRDANFLIEIQ